MSYKLVGKRGEFHLYQESHNSDVISVFLGDRKCHESEFVLSINVAYLESLIATLKLASCTVREAR